MVVLSHLVGSKASVGDGKGSAYNSIPIKLSLSCEGAFGAGNLIGMGSLPGAKRGRRREEAMGAPKRFEDRKGVIHWECRSIAAAVVWASKRDGEQESKNKEGGFDKADS